MIKHKAELLLLIILIPILVYVGWQAYRTYIRPPEMDIEGLESVEEPKKITEPSIPAQRPPEPIILPKTEEQQKPVEQISPIEPERTLDYTGYTERDPLKPVLPVKEKVEELPQPVPVSEIMPGEKPAEKTEEPPKETVLPTFSLVGFVWGAAPSTIIDNEVYKIGDIVKGAKIIDINEEGVHMEYEGKDFWLSM